MHHCMGSEFHDDFSADTTKHRGRGNQTTFSSKLFILELLVFTAKLVKVKRHTDPSPGIELNCLNLTKGRCYYYAVRQTAENPEYSNKREREGKGGHQNTI